MTAEELLAHMLDIYTRLDHQMRNSSNTIGGLANLLGADEEELEEALKLNPREVKYRRHIYHTSSQIAGASAQQSGMLQDFTQYIMIISGRQRRRPVETDVTRIIQRVHNRYTARNTNSISAMTRSLLLPLESTDPILALIDIHNIETILMRVLDNAVRWSEPADPISLTATDDGKVRITIRSAGPPVTPSTLQNLGTVLFRGADANKYNPNGGGMSLALCRVLIDQEESIIKYTTPDPRGLTVTIDLPKAPKTTRSAQN